MITAKWQNIAPRLSLVSSRFCHLTFFQNLFQVKNCLDKMSSLPLPSHYAQLVYVGSRPKPNNCCCEPPPNEFDVEHTPNLKLWLTKRNLTCGFFGSLILGLAPPKPPVIMESRKMSFKEVGTFNKCHLYYFFLSNCNGSVLDSVI